MSERNKNRFCVAPWGNLVIDPDGGSRPCCKFQHSSFGSVSLKSQGLEEVWNSDSLKSVRKQFLEGKEPKECLHCWRDEASGVGSLRESFNERDYYRNLDCSTEYSDSPITLDLKLSNTCNLKCRICSSYLSTTWLKEDKEQNVLDQTIENQAKWLSSNKIIDSESSLATFRKWAGHVKHIEIFGGEPLLSREGKEVLNIAIMSGRAKEITLLYNTNMTIFDTSIIEQWKQFKQVEVLMSIDDIGERFEYQRNPAKWSVVEENLAKYLQATGENIFLKFCCTVSVFNIFKLDEYIAWVFTNYPRQVLNFNLLHYPSHYSVTILPVEIRNQIIVKLTNVVSRFPEIDYLGEKVNEIVSYLKNAPVESNHSKSFEEVTRRLDLCRKEDFAKTFPELSQVFSSSSK